jgi:hypothetical protein
VAPKFPVATVVSTANFSLCVCRAQEYIKGIYDSGARVVVSNGSFGEMALHFIERCVFFSLPPSLPHTLPREVCSCTGLVGLPIAWRELAASYACIASSVHTTTSHPPHIAPTRPRSCTGQAMIANSVARFRYAARYACTATSPVHPSARFDH